MTALDNYLKRSGRKAGELARAIGVPHYTLSKLRSGRQRPSLEQAVALERATAGALPVGEWVDDGPSVGGEGRASTDRSGRHPLFGALSGTVTIPRDIDLTEPLWDDADRHVETEIEPLSR